MILFPSHPPNHDGALHNHRLADRGGQARPEDLGTGQRARVGGNDESENDE